MTESCVYSYVFDGHGGGDAFQFTGSLPADKLVWMHLDMRHPDAKNILSQIDGLDTFVAQALMRSETRPRLEEISNGALLMLRAVNLNDPERPEDMVSIRMWFSKNLILTTRRRQVRAVSDLVADIKNGKSPKTAGQFLAKICGHLFDRMEPTLASLDNLADKLEEKILEKPDYNLRTDVIKLRKKSIVFRRYLSPQREVVNRLRSLDVDWVSPDDKRHFLENYDRVTRYVEDLDAVRDRAQVVQDELTNALSEKLNKNMYLTSIVATIFLPLGFLTGLLGINIPGIPGAENPQAFWIFAGVLCALVAVQVALFKKWKWF